MNTTTAPHPQPSPQRAADRQRIPAFAAQLAGADRCVLCGMCLPQCPTYALQRMEGDSPRGRITLMQGLARGHLDPGSARLRGHLEGCLGCRSCEAICPAGVRFGELMDHCRAVLLDQPGGAGRKFTERLLGPLRQAALRHRWLRQTAALGARLTVHARVYRLLPAHSRLGRLLRHIAPSLARAPSLPATDRGPRGDAWLFTGCMDAFFNGPDVHAAMEVMEALGARVAVPGTQVCCGALDQHLGRLDHAASLCGRNLEVFSGTGPVVVLDSGCQAQLLEYPETLRNRVTSLTGFLSRLPIDDSRWRSEPVRVALHLPCTLRNVTREAEDIRQLFQRLPGVELFALAPPRNCCGAGGTAMLTQPAAADPLGRETLEALQATAPDVIVSPNVGCSVHLRALQAAAQTTPRIVSPARFLRERLLPG